MNIMIVRKMRTAVCLLGTLLLLAGSNVLAQTTSTGVVINGNVYGGGNAADVGVDATVNIAAGTMVNVYGGGKGQNTTVVGDVTVNIGKFTKTTTSGTETVTGAATISGSVYGGSALGTVNAEVTKNNETGVITGRTASDNKSTSVNIYRSTINGSVYGGGEGADDDNNDIEAQVCKGVIVTIGSAAEDDAPTIKKSVYGGCNANGVLWEKSEVNVVRGTIGSTDTDNNLVDGSGNVHGGGFGQKTLVMGDVEVNIGVKTGTAAPYSYSGFATIKGDVYGGSAKGNVNATPNSSDVLEATSANVKTDVNLYGGTVNGDVYGGGLGDNTSGSEIAANVYGPVTVGVYDGSVRNVFGCNNYYGSPQQNVIVNIAGGTISNNVFGGGQMADALGQITVNVTGGIVTNDVYGGGAMADTNTANWDATNNQFLFFEVTGLTAETSPVTGYYTKDGDVYTLTNDTKAKDGTTYYSHYTTTVNLTGGTVGNAYGGALGSAGKAANVWGDVYLTVDGTAFTISNDSYTEGTGDNVTTVQVPKSGRVFGCNNINGTPKREVTVHVKKTVPSGGEDHSLGTYEIASVYGGGNLAPYEPIKAESESTTDQDFASDDTKASTNVIIDGCGDTSIETVYGGGNAASTPSTKVTVNGAFEIGELFGGGNGKDKIKNGEAWDPNPGAHVGFKAYATNATQAQKDAAKYGSGQARVNIYGGKIHAIYGGSNTLGNVRRVAVAMLDEVVSTCPIAVDEAYGGGKSADMDGKAILNLGCIPGIGSVYGGARAAKVNNDVELTITNGTYTNVFGGNNERNIINGKITVNIEETGCRPIHITNLYGGGNLAAYPGSGASIADPSVTLNVKSFTSIDHIYGGGYGAGADVTGQVEVNINEVKGRWSQDYTTPETNTYNETGAATLGVIGDIYGGGYGADVIGDVEVNIGTEEKIEFVTTPTNLTADTDGKYTVEGAKITGNVYGGGYGAATTVTGNVKVNVGGQKTDGTFVGGNITIGGSVYGGSALGAVNATRGTSGLNLTSGKTTAVTLKKGNVSRYVFGGGEGNSTTTAHVYGNSTVTLYGDVVAGGLYGGCDANGKMHGDTQLNLIGGRVGVENVSTADILFGGGLGKNTTVDGNVTVNVGSSSSDFENYSGDAVTIWGNVYGGGAQGKVNTGTPGSTPFVTLVNLYKGSVHGDVYGGGLGQAAAEAQDEVLYANVDEYNADHDPDITADAFAALTDEQKIKTPAVGAKDAVAADVNGNVQVDLNKGENAECVVYGSIFGCNNTYGTPKGSATVHVYKTVARDGQAATDYDLAAVYGGGNEADYEPTASDVKNTTVIIEGCDDTSIGDVYGGGNAAAVPGTEVWILGSEIINNVYGGGNGERGAAYAAHVGYHRTSATAHTDYTTSGTYKTEVNLVAGNINNVYGGSNSNGDIRDGANVKTTKKSEYTYTTTPDCCGKLVTQHIYGGGNQAEMTGDVNIILECMPDDYVDAVYGGAANAIINGNVSLTVTSGKYGRVFGGNNEGGSINGTIKVWVKEEGCKPLEIGELYGGGNEAPYSKYGCTYNESTHKWVATPNGTTDYTIPKDGTVPAKYAIEVLVESCTSIGKIFGGGNLAEVIGNTHVEINMFHGNTTEPTPSTNRPIGTIGQVFGGGNEAKVTGKTTVDIGTDGETKVNGEVPEGQKKGVKILSSNQFINPDYDPNDATNKPLRKSITAGIYGGGNLADVDGDTELNIGTAEQSLGINIAGNIYGGGLGSSTKVTGDVTVNIGAIDGSTTAGYAVITGDVYGGSAMGKVNTTDGTTATEGKTTQVNLYGGSIIGNVYGGGYGKDDTNNETHNADVYGDVTVTVNGIAMKVTTDANDDFLTGQVFGANNMQGSPRGTVTVQVDNTSTYTATGYSYDYHLGAVYGGGKDAAFTGTSTQVLINGGSVNEVYGGGLGETATVNSSTSVTMTNGTVGYVYGGGSLANVTQGVSININGGTIDHDVYGGGALAHTNTDNTNTDNTTATYKTAVNLNGGTVNGDVYGGGLGYDDDTDDSKDVAALVYGDVTVTLNGTKLITSYEDAAKTKVKVVYLVPTT